MSEKSLPLRKCVACNGMKPKDQLFRLVRPKGQACYWDRTYKADGRGAYVCKNRDCIALAIKKKSFNRALRGPVSEEVFDGLLLELK